MAFPEILAALLISSLIAFFSTPLVIKLAFRMGIIDDPKKNIHPKVIHTYPVPRGGGIAIYIALVVTSLIFLPIDKHLIGILGGATLLLIIGILDDKYNINPYVRLMAQIISAGIPIIAGIGIAFITNPFNGLIDLSQPQISFELFGNTGSIWILSDLFALFWIILMMNILNMGAKGVDGQLPGVIVVAAMTIAVLSIKFSADITQWPVIMLALITAGSYLGFLPWNFYPQKIMPGFSGSTIAGYLLAILAILSTAKVGTLLVVVSIPLVDTGYTIVRRLLSGKSPVWGDAGHLHHRLLRHGWGKRRVALFYWFVTLLMGLSALSLNASQKLYTIIGVCFFVGSLTLILTQRKNNGKNT